ncbi:MAG: endonuclease/exonuclease/phosphatase family protein [Bacteroidales bacterium]|nr:endonuclease/exonuclease/phosphatase family protein [Bacteroidales bacterium]
MRTLLLLWLFVAPSADTLQVMFWNVENFFDWRNDSTTVSDVEFSAAGERHWTWKRFQAKANAFAKALFWVEAETGRLPDIIGLEEVENAFVLRQVLQKTALRKLDYKYVHYDSPDHRGIDVALLYRSSRFELIDSKPCHLFAADTVMATRDILLCVFRRAVSPVLSSPASSVMPDPPSFVMLDSDRASIPTFQEILGQAGNDGAFAVLVNHHPSKYGGAAESEPRRRIAVERLRFLVDSLAAIGIDRIIAGGDFNDTPDNPVFRLLEPALAPMHMELFRRGLGTIKYDGKWDLIDHIYVSPALLDAPMSAPASDSSSGEANRQTDKVAAPSACARIRILRIPFLLTRDTVHSGEKPLRTYTGPRHTGGVSDHLPVLLEVPLPP